MIWKLITKHKYVNAEYDKPIFRFFSSADDFSEINNRFCVADGITRDTLKGNIIGKPKNVEDIIDLILTAPNLITLKKASKIICKQFTLSEDENIKELMKRINYEVSIFNKREIDYLGKDYFGVTAAGGIISDEYLNCFNIGDSNIFLLNKNFDVVFRTMDDFNEREEARYLFLSLIGFNKGWINPITRMFFRKLCRNNEDVFVNGKPMSFGAITGEDKVMNFIRTYNPNLEEAQYIACFTDGYLPYFENSEVREELINTINNTHKGIENSNIISMDGFGKERTLLLYKRN